MGRLFKLWGQGCSWLLLDTQRGTITDFIQQERPERDEPGPDSLVFWWAYHTRPVAEILEEWKENYRSLDWVVIPDDVDDAVMIRWNKETDVRCFAIGVSFRRKAAFREFDRLLTMVLCLCCRRSELSIVTTAGLTIFVAMSADRHCWNGSGVSLPRHPHDTHAPTKGLSPLCHRPASFRYWALHLR